MQQKGKRYLLELSVFYAEIWRLILHVRLPEVSELHQTDDKNEAIYKLLQKSYDIYAVIKLLQNESVTFLKSIFLFNEVIMRFSNMANRLETKAAIIKNKAFGWTILKTQSNNEKNNLILDARGVRE